MLGQGAPEVVHLHLEVALALGLACLLLGDRQLLGPLVAVHAVVLQGMAGIEQQLHFLLAVALLALGHVVLGKQQVVDDGVRVGPGAEQVVALEEGVVAVAGMRDRQRLHRHGVLLHQVGDAGIGIDDDLVGQAHVPALVAAFRRQEVLAVGPVVVAHRQARRRVGIQHLLGRDDLDLVGIGIQPEFACDAGNFAVIPVDQLEGPFRTRGQISHLRPLLRARRRPRRRARTGAPRGPRSLATRLHCGLRCRLPRQQAPTKPPASGTGRAAPGRSRPRR
ncbi:hypothetical protein D3C81_1268530 [compost metagenome]